MSFLGFKKLSSPQKRNLIFLLAGLFFLAVAFLFKGYQSFRQNILSFVQPPKLIETVEEGDLPTRIIIPRVRIDLPVSATTIVDHQWQVSQTGASYLFGSGVPGREGNVIIYGHNENRLFGPIRWLEKDDQIKLINKKEEEFVYRVLETKTVSPEETEVLAPTEAARLTLYTCAGFLDRERFVVVAEYKNK